MPSRALSAAFGLIAMAAFLLPANAQNVRPVPLRAIIDHDTPILEFLCRCALSEDEKRRFSAAITEQVRQNPSYWYKNDAQVFQDWQAIMDYPGRKRAEEWLKYRFIYATQNVEIARIAAAHDPIVVLDAQRRILITERTLTSMQVAAAWVAKVTGRPQPDAQYIDKMRNLIKQNWRSWPEQTLSAVTNIVLNFPATLQYASSLPEAQGKQVVEGLLKVKAPLPEPNNTLELAAAMSRYNSPSYSVDGSVGQNSPKNMYNANVSNYNSSSNGSNNYNRSNNTAPASNSNNASGDPVTDNMVNDWIFQQNMARGACVAQYSGSGKFTTGAGAFCRPIP